VHPRDDIRIAVKECATLAIEYPGDVVLVVADGLGDDVSSGLRVVDLGSVGPSRLTRPFKGFLRVIKMLRLERPAVLHFHDPELIPVGLVARALGARVVYDVHEDVPRQIMGRDDAGVALRYVLACCAGVAEWIAARFLDAIVCATPGIGSRFPSKKTTIVQNFPIAAELTAVEPVPYNDRPRRFVYIGGITRLRGVREMMEAVCGSEPMSQLELSLAGHCNPASLRQEIESFPGIANTTYHGWLDRRQVAELLATARAGLVVLHKTPNHLNAQPIKLFEYMSAGLPVIASDFPLWREFVESTGSGILVDPTDPQAIRAAMDWILEHPEEAEEMGRKGQRSVETILNWEQEARKLISLYRQIYDPVAQSTVR
jgi:glycosyltransferase involved in cell wall biosynthesis